MAAIEVLRSNLRTREYIAKGESEGRSLLDAMKDGVLDGMQDFDTVIEQFIRDGLITREVGLAYATNPGNLQLALSDVPSEDLLER